MLRSSTTDICLDSIAARATLGEIRHDLRHDERDVEAATACDCRSNADPHGFRHAGFRNDLLFTMSDNMLPRGGPQRGKTVFTWTNCKATLRNDVRVARLVEPDGIEPTTSCLQSRRSPS